jgi:hypothetical protein
VKLGALDPASTLSFVRKPMSLSPKCDAADLLKQIV